MPEDNHPRPQRSRQRLARLLVGMVISALFLWRALANVDLGAVGSALRGGHLGLIALGFVPFLGSWVLRAWRWRALLPDGAPESKRLFSFLMLGNLGNAVLPARAGDILRAFLVQTPGRISFSCALASLFVEKLLDLLVICGLLLAAMGLVGAASLPPWVHYIMTGGAGVFLGVTLALAGWLVAGPQTDRALRWIGQKLPGATGARMADAAGRFREGLLVAAGRGRLLSVLALSGAVWGLEAVEYVVWSSAVGETLPAVPAVLVMTVANLSLLIPAAPGGLGTFDLACSQAINLFSGNQDRALAAAVLIHGAMYLCMLVLGTLCLVLETARLGASPLQALRSQEAGGSQPAAASIETGGGSR